MKGVPDGPLSHTSAIVTKRLTHFSTLSAILRESIIHFCTKEYLVGYTIGLCSNYAGPWPKHAIAEHLSGDLLATGLGNGSTQCARKTLKNSLFPLLAHFLFMEMICQQFTLPGMPGFRVAKRHIFYTYRSDLLNQIYPMKSA